MKPVTVLFLLTLLPLAAHAAPESAKEFEARYNKADLDKSGGLSRQELERAPAPGFPAVLKNFEAMDANKDGQVTLAERNAAFANAARARQAQQQRQAAEARKAWEERFAKADTNKDGALSLKEAESAPTPGFPQIRKNFAAMDADKNGKVTIKERDDFLANEARRQLQARADEADKAFAARFAKADTNKSGGLSRQEIERAEPPGFPAIKENFEAMDANKDGQVTRWERETFLKRKR